MADKKNDAILSGVPQSRRKPRMRWLSNFQNFEFEIDAVRIEISELEKNGHEITDKKEIIKNCRELLSKIECAYNRRFPRELFIWETLFLIHQKILLIAPIDELSSKWRTLKKRLNQLKEKKAVGGWNDKVISSISEKMGEQRVEQRKEKSEIDSRLRYELKELRKHLDDQVILQIWAGMKLRRHCIFFVIAASLVIALMIFLYCIIEGTQHNVVLVSGAGLLGALLSTLTHGKPLGITRAPPLVSVSMVRPAIGAIAGLFVFFAEPLLAPNVVKYPTLYAVAFVFGFSERAFYRFLKNMAGETEKNIADVMS